MAVWKGGRGVKAPYETTHVRVPAPVKAVVEKIIEDFKTNGEWSEDKILKLEESIEEARKILSQKKSARVSIEKLLTAIYKTEVSL